MSNNRATDNGHSGMACLAAQAVALMVDGKKAEGSSPWFLPAREVALATQSNISRRHRLNAMQIGIVATNRFARHYFDRELSRYGLRLSAYRKNVDGSFLVILPLLPPPSEIL